ncbi:MAG: alpha/beta hydrolase [Armatimonadetes bacterium]|nr:alpha/beta hydrolase [Armatimonadota bacterium]
MPELDSQMLTLLDVRAAMGARPIMEMDLQKARALAIAAASLQGAPEPVASVEDVRAGDVPVRLYKPTRAANLPVVVYFHGGGWVRGGVASHDPVVRAMANAGGFAVCSVEYRLAPEHRHPAAVEDGYAATRWIHENAASLGLDPSRVAVAGDSAGGHIAAVVALMARDRGAPPLVFQALVYPSTDAAADNESMREMTDPRLPLTPNEVRWYWDAYLGSDADRGSAYVSPLRAEKLDGLPPALVITAEFDPIRDEAEAYAARLEAAGVTVTRTRHRGVTHGFFGYAGQISKGRAAVMQVANTLKRAFETEKPSAAAGHLADAVFGSMPASFDVHFE